MPPKGKPAGRVQKKSFKRQENDFTLAVKDINTLVRESATGKEKILQEEEYVKSLGGKGRKNKKIPYNQLLNGIKKKKKREQRAKENETFAPKPITKKVKK